MYIGDKRDKIKELFQFFIYFDIYLENFKTICVLFKIIENNQKKSNSYTHI